MFIYIVMTEKKFKKKAWTVNHQEKYIWLYNHTKTIYPEAEQDTYIDKYKRQLLSIIEKIRSGVADQKKVYILWLQDGYIMNKTDTVKHIQIMDIN